MSRPNTKTTFKEHCLRRLGKPVIEINVDEDQVDDRVDEALDYYADYHFDAFEPTYYKHLITEQDKTNKYVTLPDNIIGVVDLFDVGDATSTNNLFNVRYQIALNDLYDLSRYELVPFYMNFQNIRMIEEILVGKQRLRYSRHMNQAHIDMDWDRALTGTYLATLQEPIFMKGEFDTKLKFEVVTEDVVLESAILQKHKALEFSQSDQCEKIWSSFKMATYYMIQNVEWKERHTAGIKEEIARCYLHRAIEEKEEEDERFEHCYDSLETILDEATLPSGYLGKIMESM